MTQIAFDPHFEVRTIASTINPQTVTWLAMHQDYYEGYVGALQGSQIPSEAKAGEYCVKHLCKGKNFHGGPFEHPQITFAVGGFPHSVMQQARTHRVGVSFDVQCLAEDTLVTRVFSSGEIRDKIKISEVYRLLESGKSVRLRSLDEEENIYLTNEVEAVVASGVKKVFLIRTENGRSIEATAEHRVLTISGWKKVKDLSVGDSVLTNGVASKLVPSASKIVSIEYSRKCHTYDIAMKAPHHNFVANGLVVHNSMRYTSKRLVELASEDMTVADVEKLLYLRPIGKYADRKGTKYDYTEERRVRDLLVAHDSILNYAANIQDGMPEEQARGLLAFDFRQNFVVSFSLRALMHFLDMRAKADAQLEIQLLCELMMVEFTRWAPKFAQWYSETRLHKGLLAP